MFTVRRPSQVTALALLLPTFMLMGVLFLASSMRPSQAQSNEGILARCSASDGRGFFFYNKDWNPTGPEWADDGIAAGKIILVNLGDEWDIQFDDILGSTGYRNDGAIVILLARNESLLSVGAFHSNYTDIYTFDLLGKRVGWSSNKLFPIPKVAAYSAVCE